MSERLEQAGLNRAWIFASAALPLEWRIEGLTCTSEGVEPGQRSDRWRAWATGPKGERIEGEGNGPIAALQGDRMHAQIAHLSMAGPNLDPGHRPPAG